MLHDIVQDIRADLQDIAQQEKLEIEANFLERVHALDALTVRILERIENVQYVHGYHAELASLYHHATQLWQRLYAVNTRLFARLREQLVAGSCLGTDAAPAVRDLCRRYSA